MHLNDIAINKELANLIRGRNERFLLYCDDLSFEADDPSYKALKAMLEGSISSPPENLLICATSNRRHLMPEYQQENQDEVDILEIDNTAVRKSQLARLAQIKGESKHGARARKLKDRARRADFAANTAEPQPNEPRKLGVDVRPAVDKARSEDPEAFPGIGQPVERYGDFEPKGGPVTVPVTYPAREPVKGESPPAKPKTPLNERFLAKLGTSKED